MNTLYNFICVIIFIQTVSMLNAQSPPSPCPNIFSYQDNLSGIIKLFADPFTTVHSITVGLSVPAKLTGNYIGNIEIGSAKEACNQMLTTGFLIYKINFPVSYPWLTSIIYNEKNLCSGRGANGIFVTNIKVSFALTCLEGHTITRSQNNFINNPFFQNTIFTQNQRPNQNSDDFDYLDDQNYNFVPNKIPNVPKNVFSTPTSTEKTTTTTIRPRNNPVTPIEECGASEFLRPLIVNGRQTDPGQFPWLTAIYYNRIKKFICGGNLITEKYVLTAGHCITEASRDPREYIIYLGVFDLDKLDAPGVQKTVGEKLEVHTDYEKIEKDSKADADIALIRIRKIRYTSNVRPICIPNNPKSIAELSGREGIIAGWGMDENGTVVTPKIRQTGVIIVKEDTCQTHIEFRTHMTARTFCAGGLNSGPCSGDSGGGLFLSKSNVWYIRGIISLSLTDRSASGCDVTNYAIYVDIASFIDWIREIIS